MNKTYARFIGTLISLLTFFLLVKSPVLAIDSEPVSPPIANPIALLLDQNSWDSFQAPILLVNGSTMLSVQDAAYLFECQIIKDTPYSLSIIKNDTLINMFLDRGDYERNGEQFTTVCPPILFNETIYLPLRDLAASFGYQISYNIQKKAVELYRPGFIPPPPPPAKPVFPGVNKLGNWGKVLDQPYFISLWEGEKIIGGYYTRLLNSSAARTKNIELSLKVINGTMLPSGNIFSFNRVVGERNTAKGYQAAPIFVGRKVVPGVGGGVCQSSSTLYNAALNVGLSIIERHPHSMRVAYVPPNRDATVSWGGADLKFKNTRPTPVKIACSVNNGYVVFALLEPQTSEP